MKNEFLQARTASDIDKKVEKILNGLGNPNPPLQLELVRELLKLDRQYYTGTSDGALREFANKITLAGKQILLRPGLIVDAVKKWDLRALYLPDQKRILLDASQPPAKQRWNEGHEIIHSILPWHEYTTFGDNKTTLTPACYDELEWEANYGAGQLLFLQKKFKDRVGDLPLEIDRIKPLAKDYGNTLTTTLWRVVEESRYAVFGAIHPHPHRTPDDFCPNQPIRYLIRSRNFAATFSQISELELYREIKSYCSWARGGPLGKAEIVLSNDRGDPYVFTFETFYNQHDALTLGVCRRKQLLLFATQYPGSAV